MCKTCHLLPGDRGSSMERQMQKSVSRRDFLKVAGGAAVAIGCRPGPKLDLPPEDPARLVMNVKAPRSTIAPGINRLGLGEDFSDGFIYVPPGYTPSKPAALLVLLHGAGHTSEEWRPAPLGLLFGARNIAVLAPDSRGPTWDMMLEGFGPDVEFLNKALASTFSRVAIDPRRIGLGGFSDGASYALSLGLRNGDLFSGLIAFSPGFVSPGTFRGKPRIFISHGRQDSVLPIDMASREIVPALKKRGYDVNYVEFDGDHTIRRDIAGQAAAWLVENAKS
jgi:phospholipase/carboxylesterase